MSRQHAILAPSAASRWLTCTPSAVLESKLPYTSSSAADEGTLAHALGELLIKSKLGMIISSDYDSQIDQITSSQYYNDDMESYMQDYSDYVIEKYNSVLASSPGTILLLEQKLDMTDYVPDGFGTGDVVIVGGGKLYIIDLKYGKGVSVSATDNKQMMLYGLGAIKEVSMAYDFDEVEMTIYQPRLHNITTFIMSCEELLTWAETELRPRALMASKGEGEFAPGDACRFCRAKATCKANAEYQQELAKYEFAEPSLLDPAEISDILSRAAGFTNWINAVQDHALTSALSGVRYPGYKLVEGRSVRVLTNEEGVVKTCLNEGLTDDQLYNKKLVGIGALEKLLTKKSFEEKLGGFVIKPPGKPTLVSEDDKRPELDSAAAAAADFQHIN